MKGVDLDRSQRLFRPIGETDWAFYTAGGLTIAVANGAVKHYYLEMLKDFRSPQKKTGEQYE